MADREKVIAALHCRAYDDDFPCWKCAYYKQDEKPVARCDYRGLMDDAIALLKEKEPVRCKDCIFFQQDDKPAPGCGFCELVSRTYDGYHYCSDGIRKEAST